MKAIVKIVSRKSLSLLILGFCVAGIAVSNANAQDRDPFRKPVVAAPKPKKPAGTAGGATKPKAAPGVVVAPPIEQRISAYKAMRQRCMELGIACPKPTSVLTLDEMQVNGVFRTPRGYAAMVEAVPIKLSYTIYPGEQFYDGQLVAIEESRLIFRRVTKMNDGKQVVVADSKALRQTNINELAQTRAETAPLQTNPTVAATAAPTAAAGLSAEAVPQPVETAQPAAAEAETAQPKPAAKPRKSKRN